MSIRAFRVQTRGFPDGITFAEDASKARYTAYAAANEVGFALGFDAFRVTRAPEYDERRYCGSQPTKRVLLETCFATPTHEERGK